MLHVLHYTWCSSTSNIQNYTDDIFTILLHVEHDVLQSNDKHQVRSTLWQFFKLHPAQSANGGLSIPHLAPKGTWLRPVCPIACASACLVVAAHNVVSAAHVHGFAFDAPWSDEREAVRQHLREGTSQLQADVEAGLHGWWEEEGVGRGGRVRGAGDRGGRGGQTGTLVRGELDWGQTSVWDCGFPVQCPTFQKVNDRKMLPFHVNKLLQAHHWSEHVALTPSCLGVVEHVMDAHLLWCAWPTPCGL